VSVLEHVLHEFEILAHGKSDNGKRLRLKLRRGRTGTWRI
jgi:hypothetical protein